MKKPRVETGNRTCVVLGALGKFSRSGVSANEASNNATSFFKKHFISINPQSGSCEKK